jgi:hypothetical protein
VVRSMWKCMSTTSLLECLWYVNIISPTNHSGAGRLGSQHKSSMTTQVWRTTVIHWKVYVVLTLLSHVIHFFSCFFIWWIFAHI